MLDLKFSVFAVLAAQKEDILQRGELKIIQDLIPHVCKYKEVFEELPFQKTVLQIPQNPLNVLRILARAKQKSLGIGR